MRRHLWLTLCLAASGCARPDINLVQEKQPPAPTAQPSFVSVQVTSLPGWAANDFSAALSAFVLSCKAIALMPPDQPLGGAGIAKQIAGQAGQWQPPCAAAQAVDPGDPAAAQAFFEGDFRAYALTSTAQITGYFEPEFPGSKNYMRGYTIPIYGKPADPDLAKLPRAAIDGNALYSKAPVTAYLSSPADAYMLQNQAAGRILLPDGNVLRVGFDGDNGQPYTPIGRVLVEEGALPPDGITFTSVLGWLHDHRAQAKALMEQNANYVYLRPLGDLPETEGAPGALGVPITAGRTLAVDQMAIPLGIPVFLVSTNPRTSTPMDVLAIAQDTDSGLHGPNAAKLFLGSGADAEATVSIMHQSGQLYLLLPRPSPSS